MGHKITDEDKASASRGLKMTTLNVGQLQDLIEVHSAIDAFASQVIVEAAKFEAIQRGVQHA